MNQLDPDGRRPGVVWAGVALAAFVCATAGAGLRAQTSAQQEPRFEVVSVKRNAGGGPGSMMAIQPGGRLSAVNLFVRQVIVRAYGIQPFQLTGGPDWMQSERYDIQAKAPDGAVVTGNTMNVMLQTMLADRFKLKVRRETRESAVYELVFARGDRRLGEKLRQTDADCVARLGDGTRLAAAPAQIGPLDAIPCGTIMTGGNRLAAGGQTMAQLATMLGPRVQRLVVDRTGLTGPYDFDLQFLPDEGYGRTGADGPVRVYLVGKDVPPLTTAIQDQLGLKLQPARGPVEYVVIESIERPAED
jgi:uncharacterized protein (TIGR03435 family)